MAFDPKRHVIKVQGGREYLPVSARLVWFRSEHPDWGIVTQAVEINLEKQYAIFTCSIFNEEGRVMATATKMENVKGFGDYIEKSETGAVGRALAMCGYGTQFAPELEEGNRYGGGSGGRYNNRPNMAPAPPPPSAPPQRQSAPPPDYNSYPREQVAQRAPAPTAPVPAPVEDEPPAAPPVASSRPAPVVRVPERAAPERPQPAPGITRVREPERDLPDPGGEFEDEEDPFVEEELPAAPPRPAAAPPRANGNAQTAPRPATVDTEPVATNRPEGSEKPQNSLPRCSVEGCANVLTSGQHTMSMQKFGKPICLMHQRDPAVIGASNGARRPAKSDLL